MCKSLHNIQALHVPSKRYLNRMDLSGTRGLHRSTGKARSIPEHSMQVAHAM